MAAFGWKWGFFGAAIAGIIGIVLILLFLHDTPESKGLEPIELLAGEKSREELEADRAAASKAKADQREFTRQMQRAVRRSR